MSTSHWKQTFPSLLPSGILAGLNQRSLKSLSTYGAYLHCPAGDRIITEGHKQDLLYILVSGKLENFATVKGSSKCIAQVEPGECLGEMNILIPNLSAITVNVIEDSILWSIDVDSLLKYIIEHPGGGGALLLGMAQVLSNNLRKADRRIIENNAIPNFIVNRNKTIITAPKEPKGTFFDIIKKNLAGGKNKVRIPTKIKL